MKKTMIACGLIVAAAVAAPPEGMKWETAAIQAQIDAAAAKGGGRVTVAKGVHPCRTLYMKSGVELHLEKGAVILGGTKECVKDTFDVIVLGCFVGSIFLFFREVHC